MLWPPLKLNGRKHMRQFNLQEYLKTPSIKIITRNHCPARIICTDKIDNHNANIVALIHSMDPEMDYEYTEYYTEDGMYLPNKEPHPRDLFFVTESDYTEWWINLYKVGKQLFTECAVFPTKEQALQFRTGRCYLTTVKVDFNNKVKIHHDSKNYGWVRIYEIGDKRRTDGYIHMSKEQAENSYSIQGIDSNVAMIEWEE